MASDSASPKQACTLPSEKVFSIQIGSEIFRLSGASIASDAPSYFSQFFEEQLQLANTANIRTLYIDRDPETFRDIARHLQGYHVRPSDGAQFVKLFADSQFYSCSIRPVLILLFESEIFIQIGDRHFQIPRDIFSGPGDSPNFFTLGFGAFFASPSEVFPGLNRNGLLRPPAIVPPSVPNRSADVFAEILHLLRGYPLHIRNESHRAELLRDCRYFHLRGVEQKLIPHKISFNPFSQRSEIVVRVEDVRPSGIGFSSSPVPKIVGGLVVYARPFVDENPADLILEIGGDATLVNLEHQRADFLGQTKSRMASLIQVVGKKANIPETQLGGLPIGIRLSPETDLTVDGEPEPSFTDDSSKIGDSDAPPAKRQRSHESQRGTWVVRTGQWRLQVHPTPMGSCEAILTAVKLYAFSSAQARSHAGGFL
ncbi:hypothetical protein N7492_002562 [Penicillium capsulatum]|uniref:Potassium channel tetramerisation-type BTB domain-containing protein n=1 Tax=Penicillium capsulatum TaxID=69766 RepID=A0A9W9IKC0_9EURO|nr:hypothetical protein N7492_002562 [Penicillium capsulatum]KAJ6122835.1 hypothetical protein N7512_005300 [Penicillium capsulatum]